MIDDSLSLDPIQVSHLQDDEKAPDGLLSQGSEEISPDGWDQLKGMLEKEGDDLESVRNRVARTYDRKLPYMGEDIAQEALLRTAKYIARGGQIHKSVQATLFETARRVWLELIRHNPPIPIDDDDGEPIQIATDGPNIEEQIIEEEIRDIKLNCMRKCFGRLTRDERVFLAGHSTAENKSEYAVKQGMTPQEGRMKAFSLRQKIKQCRDRCLQKNL